MKKITLVYCLLTLFIHDESLAKKNNTKKIYAGIHSSYHIGLGGSLNNYYNATASSMSATYSHQKMNFGKGVQSGITLGYLITNNIGLEVGLSNAFKNKNETNISIKPAWSGTYTENQIINNSSIFISPAILIKTSNESFNLYSKFGVTILKGKSNIIYSENNNGDRTEVAYNIEGISGVGLRGGIGTLIKLSKSLDLQFEINSSSVAGSPKREIKTKHIENGIDKLPSLTISEKETDFVKEFTITQTPNPTSEPNQALKIYLPYNNLGIQLGLQFKF